MGVPIGYSGTGKKGAEFNPPNQATQKGLEQTLAKVDEASNVQTVILDVDNLGNAPQKLTPQFAQRDGRLEEEPCCTANDIWMLIFCTIGLLVVIFLIVWGVTLYNFIDSDELTNAYLSLYEPVKKIVLPVLKFVKKVVLRVIREFEPEYN